MADNRNFLIHPKILGLYILLFGVSTLFLAFSAAYVYNRVQTGINPIQLPMLFILNTLILVASSYTLHKSMRCYKEDKTEAYKSALGLTLALTIVFLISQIIAWKQLYQNGLAIDNDNMTSFLYLISIVHFGHVIVGIPFLALFYYNAIKKMVEPVSVLIYFSDPVKKRKLQMISIYWHFLDGLWIYLVVFFLLNSLIKLS